MQHNSSVESGSSKLSSSVNLTWAPFWALYVREMHRFMKVIVQTVFSPLINATLYLLVFGVSMAQVEPKSGVSYLAFLIPGLVMLSVLNNSFQNSSSSIVSGKFSGDLEDWRVVPLSLQQIMWALSFGALTRGLLVGFVTFLVGTLFHFLFTGSWLFVAHPFPLLFFLVAGGLCFGKLGIAVAFWAKSFDQVTAVGSFILLPLIYLGGVFFSIESLPGFWQSVSHLNPVLYFINGVRYGILGHTDVPILQAYLVSVLAVIALHIAGLRALSQGNYQRW